MAQWTITKNGYIAFITGSTPANPPSGYIAVYSKTDGSLYYLKSDGTETKSGT